VATFSQSGCARPDYKRINALSRDWLRPRKCRISHQFMQNRVRGDRTLCRQETRPFDAPNGCSVTFELGVVLAHSPLGVVFDECGYCPAKSEIDISGARKYTPRDRLSDLI
jgi:hypothetical protein